MSLHALFFFFKLLLIQSLFISMTLAADAKKTLQPLALECRLQIFDLKTIAPNKTENSLREDFKINLSGLGPVQTSLEREVLPGTDSSNAKNKSTWEMKTLITAIEKGPVRAYQINGRLIETQEGVDKPLREVVIPLIRLKVGEPLRRVWPLDKKETFELNCVSQ